MRNILYKINVGVSTFLFLIIAFSCDKIEYEGVKFDAPVAGFTLADTSDIGLNGQIKFLNSHINGVDFFWDFGDGNVSQEVEPIHSFTKTGTYKVSLLVRNGTNGSYLTDEFTQTYTVNTDPFAWFNTDPVGKKGVEHQFTNKSNRAVSYLWDFGDESTSTDENPTHAFSDAGNYTITLTAKNNDGSASQWSEDISIVAPILEELFDNGIPQGWTVIDGGEQGITWADSVDYSMWGGPVMYFDYVTISNQAKNDDWLITNKIKLEGDHELSIDVQEYAYTLSDAVNIYVSKGTTNAGDFTYYVGTIYPATGVFNYVTYKFSLSGIPGISPGDEIYIGFHVNTNNSGVYIDNVVVI